MSLIEYPEENDEICYEDWYADFGERRDEI